MKFGEMRQIINQQVYTQYKSKEKAFILISYLIIYTLIYKNTQKEDEKR